MLAGGRWAGGTPARTPISRQPPRTDFPAPFSGRLLQISSSRSQGIAAPFAPLDKANEERWRGWQAKETPATLVGAGTAHRGVFCSYWVFLGLHLVILG